MLLKEALRAASDASLFRRGDTEPRIAKPGGSSVADLDERDVEVIEHD